MSTTEDPTPQPEPTVPEPDPTEPEDDEDDEEAGGFRTGEHRPKEPRRGARP